MEKEELERLRRHADHLDAIALSHGTTCDMTAGLLRQLIEEYIEADSEAEALRNSILQLARDGKISMEGCT